MCADGAAWSMMVGIGESYLPAFVLALTANQFACGLVATIPMLTGAILQLASPQLIQKLGSYRRWVVTCATIQAAAFIPLVVIALFDYASLWLIFAIASVYWGAGLATAPAWNAWVETLVPNRLRAKFFARRARVSQIGLILGFTGGGLLLEAASQDSHSTTIFAVLFGMAMLSRLLSACFLARQREWVGPGFAKSRLGSLDLKYSVQKNLGSRLLRFMLAMQLAAWIAGPYFTPYMFLHLKLSYAEFMILTCAAYLAKMVCLPGIGMFCRRSGTNRVLWISGIMIAMIPVLWLIHDGFAYLLVLQVLAGAAWAGLELATFLMLFETIPASERIGTLTVFNLVNAAALTIGSILGGVLLAVFPSAPAAYGVLFAISSFARGGSLLFLTRVSKISAPAWHFATRTITLRPSLGSIERPILPLLTGQPKERLLTGSVHTRMASASGTDGLTDPPIPSEQSAA
ncbi:MAG: MFS transporter [Pirellulales bacterium]|nr:MFS transporter [Pirellulales bacterium]